MTPQELQDIADMLGVDLAIIEAWHDDLGVIYEACLDSLSAVKRAIALKYLIMHFASSNGGQSLTSYRLGDESWGYKDAGSGMSGTSYGRLAVSVAPCLAGADTVKRYGAIRLVR